MAAIDDRDIVRCRVVLRNPFTVEHLPFLSRVHRFAYLIRRRGLTKRLFGKPAKFLFRLLVALGVTGTGRVRVETPRGTRVAAFNARNVQFSALYMPYYKPVYEPETCAVLDRLIGDQGVFFDIGANWGWYSVLIATRPSFAGSVHAFEPFPPSFADLAQMIDESALRERVHCHQIALAEKEGEAVMELPDGLHSGLAKLGGREGVKVRIAALDRLNLPMPDVMKIDVETYEMDVLRGAAAIIAKARPYIIIENGYNPNQLSLAYEPLRYLNDAGYILFYAAWADGDPDRVICNPGYFIPAEESDLALLPFLPLHRPALPPLLNIIAVPKERMGEFRQRLS
jgi:FkbM family methyltransferase